MHVSCHFYFTCRDLNYFIGKYSSTKKKLRLYLNFEKLACWLDTHGKDQSNSKTKSAENLEDNAINKDSQVEPDDGCSSSHRGEYFNHCFNLENLTSYLVGICSLINSLSI